MREIVLNEVSLADALLMGDRVLNDYRRAFSLIARYDVQVDGLPKEEVVQHLKDYGASVYPKLSPDRVGQLARYYAENGSMYKLSNLSGVPIFQEELDVILLLPTKKAICVSFALLALAKLDTMREPEVNYWVSGDRWTEIAKRANVSATEYEVGLLLHPLQQAGHLELAKRVDNCSVRPTFVADAESEPTLFLNDADYQDLGYALRAHLGEPFSRCEECGHWIRQSKQRNRRFCDGCAAESKLRAQKKYNSKR